MLGALIPTAGTTPLRSSAGGVGVRGLLTEIICAVPRTKQTTGTRAYCERKGSFPDSAVGVRVGCDVSSPPCQLPVQKVPGWRALEFPLGLWVAPKRLPGADTEAEVAGEDGTASC